MFRFSLILPGIFLASLLPAGANPVPKVQDLVSQHCAVCHGPELDGGLGGSLVDGQWMRGANDEDITRVIEEGIPDMGMIPFAAVLTPEQIRALVIYIREKENSAKLAAEAAPKIGGEHASDLARFRIERLAGGLDIPWAIAFLPEGGYLVTERPGRLRRIEPDGTVGEPVAGLPPILHHGQGGLMEVALHPDYAENGWIYLGFAAPHPEGVEKQCQTKVVRGRIRDGRWVDEETIWSAPVETYSGAGVHFGVRFVFNDGYLWFGIGDRGHGPNAQNLSRPEGKIFRLHDDGRIPEDNPFVKTAGARPDIWSYGHRNPQGLVRDPATGALYETEHGPRGGDELNLILPGKNYGWPEITFGMNYSGTPITAQTAGPQFEPPLLHWTPSIAACGLDIAHGTQFSSWNGDLFAGGLASKQLRRIRLRDGQVEHNEIVLRGIGRIRDVRFGLDGLLYLVLNEPHEIVRLVPIP